MLISERAPLLHTSRISEAIYQKYQGAETIDTHECTRKIAWLVSGVATLGSGVAYLPISSGLPAAPFFMGANLLGFSKLSMWAINDTIDELWGPKQPKEISLIDQASNQKCKQVAAIAAAVPLSVLSQIPTALPSLQFDGNMRIPALISLFVGGALIPLRSLQLSFEKIFNLPTQRYRPVLQSLIETHLRIFQKMGMLERVDCLRRFEQELSSHLEVEKNLTEQIFRTPLEAEESPLSAAQISAHVIGGLITASFQAGTAVYTYTTTKKTILDQDVFAVFLTSLVMISSIYLTGLSIINRVVGIVDSTSLSLQLRPKLAYPLQLIGAVVDAGALGASCVIWKDFYKDNLYLQLFFTITTCLAYFLFLSASTQSLVRKITESYIHKNGTPEEQQVLQFESLLEHMKKLISRSSDQDCEELVQQLPETLKVRLFRQMNYLP